MVNASNKIRLTIIMYGKWDIKYISFNRDGKTMKKTVQRKNDDPNKIKYSFIRGMFVLTKICFM